MKSVTIRDLRGNTLIRIFRTKEGIDVETIRTLSPVEVTAMCYTDKPKRYTRIKVKAGERK